MQPMVATASLSQMVQASSNGEAEVPSSSPQHVMRQQPIQPLQARETQKTASSVSTTSTNSVMDGLASRPEHQALYQAQQQQPMNTPWTLGSTDGSFATQVALMQEQQNQQNQNSDDAPPFVTKPSPTLTALAAKQSLYQDRLLRQPSAAVETVLAASCEVMGFDIAEIWLRTGPRTHQLTNSHLRPTALEDSVRNDLVDVYYGQQSSERTHRLSPALCKRAKEAGDVVWVTSQTPREAQALKASISNVRTAVAVPVCHEASNTNITVIFFSIRKMVVRPTSVEFLVHMALSAGVAAVNSLHIEGLASRDTAGAQIQTEERKSNELVTGLTTMSSSEHVPNTGAGISIRHQRVDKYSVTGAELNLQWRQLQNVEYLTDGGNSWIHTAVFNDKPVVVKTLKPECQDVVVAINEMEGELDVHSRLHHPNIVDLLGAGTTSRGVRFVVLERLDGGTLTQMLGYDTRIRDRRRRFWRRKQFAFVDVLRIARSIAEAMVYCHESAVPGCVVLHRDLKPDNIGFTLDGTVKVFDFGLARIIENANIDSDDVYQMSGETGSLRYMAPEVADGLPYNYSADVYSFGIIFWELNSGKKPFDGLNRESFYERIVHGGERPALSRKWPRELTTLMTECWDADMHNRPKFRVILQRLDSMLAKEKGGSSGSRKHQFLPKISGMIDRHSTWF